MNRRATIVGAVGVAVTGAASTVLPRLWRRPALSTALADLYDDRFVDALPMTLEAMAARLFERGVLVGDGNECGRVRLAARNRWRFDVDRVGAIATDDALIEFDHSLYTETELLLYSFVARLRSSASGPRLASLMSGATSSGRVWWSRESEGHRNA